jgi:hypothetical protein
MVEKTNAHDFVGAGQTFEAAAGTTRRSEQWRQQNLDKWFETNEYVTDRAVETNKWFATPQGKQYWDTQMTPGQKLQIGGWIKTWTGQEVGHVAGEPRFEPAWRGGFPFAAGTPGVEEAPMEKPEEAAPGTPAPAAIAGQLPPGAPPDLRNPVPPKNPNEYLLWSTRRKAWLEHGGEPTSAELGAARRAAFPARTSGALTLQEYIDETVAATGQRPSASDLIRFEAGRTGEIAAARLGGTMAERMDTYANEVAMALRPAIESSRALPRGRIMPFNELMQRWQKGTSDIRYNEFMVTNLSLLNAYVRAMNPMGIPRIGERAETHAIGLLSMATDQAAYEAQARKLWLEVDRFKKAVALTRSGEPPPDPFEGLPPLPTPGGKGAATIAPGGVSKDDLAEEMKRRGLHP